MSTTLAQVRALVDAVLERPGARAIGVQLPVPWDGPETLLVNGRTLRVRQCDSPLEVREALLDGEERGTPVVIVTPLADGDLESDVRARLERGRVLVPHRWDAVRARFRVRDIDPRLVDEPALADALVDETLAPVRPVAARLLDLDTAWELLAESLKLPSGRPDVLALLRWADDAGAVLAQAPGALIEALRRRVSATAGPAGEAVFDCVTSDGGGDAVALGLVCGVIFHPDATGEARVALERAAGRLERYCGDRVLPAAAGQVWAQAAETLVGDQLQAGGLAGARPLLARADELLREVEGHTYASLGRFSLLGFEQRLAHLAEAFLAALDDGAAPEAHERVARAAQRVQAHGLAVVQAERVERVDMAVRLLRWLAGVAPGPRSFEEAAQTYASDTGYVDRARAVLDAGDGCEALSQAYSRLLARAAARREQESERFARLLRDWLASSGSLTDALRVEDVLARVVAPLSERAPVLLLVVDGLSIAVYREVLADLVREGWIEIVPDGAPDTRAVVAALPTVTEVSRASLLGGRLCQGVAADEKAAFEGHAKLFKVGARKPPPVLFHKADLLESGAAGLASRVRAAIADPGRQVVGVVVNAVDDHLSKGDQIRPRWSIETIRPLRPILHAAVQAGRVVVLTSDHGHVPERGSQAGAASEAERWRADDGAPAAGEVVLAGARVLARGQRLIAPWTERLRYAGRKNGYHGGASPQEVVIPLGVFTTGADIAGWREIAPVYPAWWTGEPAGTAAPAPAPVRRRPRADKAQVALPFEGAPPAAASSAVRAGWIDVLLKSAVWKTQVQAAGRVAPEAERLRHALVAFEERGGKLTRAALSHKLGIPPVRVGGFVAALRRLLNVDGYEVLACDDASDSLTLNRELLRKQFALGED